MALSLPQGYTALKAPYEQAAQPGWQVKNAQQVSIIGVVVDALPTAPTNGEDWQTTVTIQDPSLRENFIGGFGLRIKFFTVKEKAPSFSGPGDVVVIKTIKIGAFQGNPCGMSWKQTQVMVFPAANIPSPAFKLAYVSSAGANGAKLLKHETYQRLKNSDPDYRSLVPTPAEQLYAIELADWYRNNLGSRVSSVVQAAEPAKLLPQRVGEAPIGAPTGPRIETTRASTRSVAGRFSLLKDVEHGRFCDLVGEVVKVYFNDYGKAQIYVTDYTTNESLWEYLAPEEDDDLYGAPGAGYGQLNHQTAWPGPYGRMTIQIQLWEPHASYAAPNVHVGDVIFVRNVHIKYNPSSKLEGSLHQDRQYPHQIDIREISRNDEKVRSLLERRAEYLNERAQKTGGRRLKPFDDSHKIVPEGPKKKKQKKNKGGSKVKMEAVEADSHGAQLTNKHVRCRQVEGTTVISIGDIIDNPMFKNTSPGGVEYTLPFTNMNCRARVRIVAFHPPNLEDFAVVDDAPPQDDMDAISDRMNVLSMQPRTRWVWNFWLLVEDSTAPQGSGGSAEPHRLSLLVADKEAEHLLCLDATDLRKDEQTLAQLKEKMFIMWGDLEELSAAGHQLPLGKGVGVPKSSSTAFECCIQEYGVQVQGQWVRIHRMHGTTIS